MKTIALLLFISAFASSASKRDPTRVKWNWQKDDPQRTSSLFELPVTQNDALSAGWIEAKGVNSLASSLYCMENDPRVCVVFDQSGSKAGFQVSFLASDLEPTQNVYNFSKIDAYKRKKVFDYDVWVTTVYTINPKTLGRDWDQEMRDDTETVALWIETPDGYLEIPKRATDLDSVWLKQVCVPEQGTHYFYNMSTSLPCENVQPWFSLYDEGELVGGGIMGFGRVSIASRNWWEVLLAPIGYTIPDGPKCLGKWLDQYGTIFMHFFLIEEPWHARC